MVNVEILKNLDPLRLDFLKMCIMQHNICVHNHLEVSAEDHKMNEL